MWVGDTTTAMSVQLESRSYVQTNALWQNSQVTARSLPRRSTVELSSYLFWRGRQWQVTPLTIKAPKHPPSCCQVAAPFPSAPYGPNNTWHWLPWHTMPDATSYNRDPFLQSSQPQCMAYPMPATITTKSLWDSNSILIFPFLTNNIGCFNSVDSWISKGLGINLSKELSHPQRNIAVIQSRCFLISIVERERYCQITCSSRAPMSQSIYSAKQVWLLLLHSCLSVGYQRIVQK